MVHRPHVAKETGKDSTWPQSHMPVSTEKRPSQHMLGRGLLICGKSAGGCTEVTVQPPLLRSTVLPECIIAAMLPWQPAHRPGSMPSCVLPTPTRHPAPSLSPFQRDKHRAYYQSCWTGVSPGGKHYPSSCKWALLLSPLPCQAALTWVTTGK